jgi:hypothetical protein
VRSFRFAQTSHNGGDVVSNPNDWTQISNVLDDVLKNGVESTYKTVSNKTMVVNGKTVEVIFKRLNGKVYISDAWVRP